MPKKSPVQIQVDPREEELKALRDRLARALADYSNLEKRFAKDSTSVIHFANASLVIKLLDIRDHLEATAKHFTDPGVKMILDSLDKILAEEGVQAVETAGVFDPATMECSETVEGEQDEVISVQRAGYRLHDRILRPARVTVGNSQVNNKVK